MLARRGLPFALTRLRVAALALGVGLLVAPDIQAQPTPLSVEGVSGNVVELRVTKGGHEGSFTLKNTGPRPLPLRLHLDSQDSDPRLPVGVSVAFENKTQEASLTPGETRQVIVQWTPSRGKAREVYGTLTLEGTNPPVHLGIHGELDVFPANRILSLLVALPFLCALLAFGATRGQAGLVKAHRWGAGLQVALASWLLFNLDRDFGRIDGNEGLQFIEARSLGSIELFLGADGASSLVAWLLAASLLMGSWLCSGTTAASLAMGVAGLTLAAFSQNLALLWGGLALGLAGLGLFPAQGKQRHAFAALSLLSLGLLGACFFQLSGAVDAPLHLDGSAPMRSFSLPAILRSEHLAPGRTSLGLPLAAGAFVLLCAGALPLAGAWPAGGWLRGATRRPGAMLLAGPLALCFFHTLLRLGSLAVPEGVVWGATSLAWIGAALALLGGLGALGEQEEEARFPWWISAQIGLGLVGFGAGTAQGLAGAMGCGVAMTLGSLLAASGGTQTGAWSKRLGALVTAGVPGLVGFWGPALALYGAFPRQPVAAVAAALGWLAAVAAALRAQRGERAEATTEEAPMGQLRLGLAGLILVLGLWPGGLLGGLERWSLDLASFLHTPGPAWVATRSSFPPGHGGSYGDRP